MDERVSKLKTAFPQIFEQRVSPIEDLDDDFVRIDVPARLDHVDGFDEEIGTKREDDREAFDLEEELLADLDRWEEHSNVALVPPYPDGTDTGISVLRHDLVGRRRPDVFDRLRKRIKGTFPGCPSGLKDASAQNFVPPPDALAFYLPFHRYPNDWGIYLVDAGVASLALDLQTILCYQGHHTFSAYETRRIALAYLFHHEAYHCAVEGFAIRSELPMRRPAYRTGFRKIFNRLWVPGAPHEETLATAYSLRKIRNLKLPASKLKAALDALCAYLSLCPPLYAAGAAYVVDEKFVALELAFKEEAINSCHPNRLILDSDAWPLATHMLTPLLQRNRKYSWICDRNDFRKRSRLAVHYFRRSDVISCLQHLAAARIEQGGRHLHLIREINSNGTVRKRRTQVPSGEVRDGTLSGMLKDLELDLNVHSFRQKCRDVGRSLS